MHPSIFMTRSSRFRPSPEPALPSPLRLRRLGALALVCAPLLGACDSPAEPPAPPAPPPAATPAPTPAAAASTPAQAGADRGRPDTEVFRAALADYFKDNGALCLLPSRSWPVFMSDQELRVDQSAGLGGVKQMDALEGIGFVMREDVPPGARRGPGGAPGLPGPGRSFRLTEAATPFTMDVHWSLPTGPRDSTEICWGRRAVDKVTRVFGPSQRDDLGTQVAEAQYTYRVENQAPWATRPEILAAFPDLKKTLDGAGQATDRLSLKLTVRGWQVMPPATTGSSFEIRRRGAATH